MDKRMAQNQIEDVCKSLVRDTVQCEQDLIPTSILSASETSNEDLNQVDQSFMYSQLLKDILLEMIYDKQALNKFVQFCRVQYENNERELKIISEFEESYHQHSPVWWYTRECFIYQMLNRCLRLIDVDIIAMMAFLMKDIHEQLKQLNEKREDSMTSFKVYRGQGMFEDEFDHLRRSVGGLLSFNSFLSTTINEEIALNFARQRKLQQNKIGLVFLITIDPTLTSIPFASLDDSSRYKKKEGEILFSMHTIFRIIDVRKKDDQIWIVELKSVRDTDPQITRLTEQIRRQISEGNATDRLGQLMITIGELKKAEHIYDLLLDSTPQNDQRTLARIYNQLAYIQCQQGDWTKAESLYQKALQIQENLRPSSDLDLATTYSNIGVLYTNPEHASLARSYHQKALVIREQLLHQYHPDLATTYNNIGLVCDQLKDYSTALTFYNKTLLIYQRSLVSNHPWLATAYKNIGLAQISLKEHRIGLENLLQAMKIRTTTLPSNHPSIASIYNTIGGVYEDMKDYSIALTYYKKAFDVEERVAHSNEYRLAMACYNLSRVLNELERFDSAKKYAERALEVGGQCLASDNSDLIELREHCERLRRT